MTRAFVFPGQGSQAVGMGQSLAEAFPAAKAVFQEVDEALGQDLSGLMANGPADELTLTENAQPALMAVSMAVMKALESEGNFALADHVRFVAGHSLGEYSALCAAGAISITDAAKLLKVRGKAMQAAVPVGVGAMAAILGPSMDVIKEIAEEAAQGQVCSAANDNANGQVVVSGHKEAVERAMALAKEKGAKRAVPLPVSAPFHCSLMQPAADAMAEALVDVAINAPVVPVIANVTASAVDDPEEIKQLLVDQVVGAVRWRECGLYMKANGVTEMVEVGAGKVLSGLAKRIDRDLSGQALNEPDQIKAFLEGLSDD